MARIILVSIILVIFVSSTIAVVPSYFKICGRHDPNLNQCVERSIDELKIKLQRGIPELDVPSMETLEINEITVADIRDFRAVATNVKIRGIPNFVIKHLNVDLKNEIISLDLNLPKIYMDADYNVEARIIVPINEKGPISITTENVGAKVALKLKTVERRGRQLVYFPKMTMKLAITDYTANFNSGAKNSPLTETINTVLVSSKDEIIVSLIPNLEKAMTTKIIEIINKICKNFTYDELFPDRS